MYMSRVEIDTWDRTKIRDLTHVGAFHSWVENSFPEEKAQQVRTRKLWRVDKFNGKQYLLVVSQDAPDLALLERYGVSDTASTKSYDKLLRLLKKGDRLRFKIALNPVVCRSRGEGKRGVVTPCLDEGSQIQYLLDRAEANGFSLSAEEVSIVERGNTVLQKSNSGRIKFIKAVYEGILTVQDADRFRVTLSQGMGKHKAYGFGMLTVLRAGNDHEG